MKLKFSGKTITGILAGVPSSISYFDDEIENYDFPPETTMKLKVTMGYDKHRVVKEGTCISDMAEYLLNYLFDKELLKKDEVDALLIVTETPDYILPPTSNVIQGKLGMKEDMICLDINQGCAGFEVGLIQAFSLLDQEEIRKAVLINAEALSRKTSKRDRNSYPLIGDAAAVTIVERSEKDNTIYANIKMDGKGADAIRIPAGGLKCPASASTGVEHKDDFGNWRSADNLVMKGDEVFMFVQKKVPPLINEILEYSGKDREDINYFMFHQPNKFMLNKLASKLKIPKDKMPSNIVEQFGNSSGVTVPLNIAFNIGNRLEKEILPICMAGFGVGLVWSSIVMDLGPLKFCDWIEFPKNI